MKIAYYPGCSLHSTGIEYDLSGRRVCQDLDIELQELPDWTCCGASSAHVTDHVLALALPARNLALADDLGLDVTAPCAACYNRLQVTRHELAHDPKLRQEVEELLGRPYTGRAAVRSLVDLVASVGEEAVRQRTRRPLRGLKVAAYYGCLLVRPAGILQPDDPENPQGLDRILAAAGAEPVEWPFKTECCGASFALTDHTEVVTRLVAQLVDGAQAAGAEAIVTACPLCHSNLDMRQETAPGATPLPVYYFTELLGIAFGHSAAELGIGKHSIDGTQLLAQHGWSQAV
ncbi:MAG: CoB--CoM heterodisulfide reductase iron-sulfur subunit B family protein [Firmicutes bacterium]|nr:CoB--CoM heterodisulfide reductase iron-sulfur subunit B family protein [Bacillota bacterium]